MLLSGVRVIHGKPSLLSQCVAIKFETLLFPQPLSLSFPSYSPHRRTETSSATCDLSRFGPQTNLTNLDVSI
ncbi:hypothetical protein BHE74_00049967 [Ensete ventricosum]|uniref:Uncharacterized protein n=1 Tax=Ensete ventricosum TaxID=4639 RepID=A0A426ZJ74_ENSVE|nr:hypothetical protein B296_00040272 [Ensete ventricosum]RWW14149.1 hypothetical protein GW17_00022100 [Ensete ventricosum]RWW44289.1 hypothetical protein BHE74_00049967 [Ensete ventricosum]RZR92794.1 hypothetical protein BHM03_00021149 [Ensete ventricosum]